MNREWEASALTDALYQPIYRAPKSASGRGWRRPGWRPPTPWAATRGVPASGEEDKSRRQPR